MIDPVHITPKPTNMKKARHIDEPSFFDLKVQSDPRVERPFPLKRSVAHATGGTQCSHESCESGYYHLHHHLNNTILLHLISSSPLISFLISITHFSFLIWQEAFRPLPFNLRLPGSRHRPGFGCPCPPGCR